MKMKKLIYSAAIVSLLFFSQTANAQINLMHTFDGSISWNWYSPTINYYTGVNITTKQVNLYNEDYSLYKSVTVTPPAGYDIANTSNFSKNIVTTDGKITFFVFFTNFSTDANSTYAIKLYDENGTVVKDFGYSASYSINIHSVSNNKYRLSFLRLSYNPYPTNPIYKTEIYSLPGTAPTPTNVKSMQIENTSMPPYPNPANTIITLPYQLKQGEMSIMRIYNINGQLIETKQIDSVFDKILLNVSGYAKGMYLYEVNGVSNRFVVD